MFSHLPQRKGNLQGHATRKALSQGGELRVYSGRKSVQLLQKDLQLPQLQTIVVLWYRAVDMHYEHVDTAMGGTGCRVAVLS